MSFTFGLRAWDALSGDFEIIRGGFRYLRYEIVRVHVSPPGYHRHTSNIPESGETDDNETPSGFALGRAWGRMGSVNSGGDGRTNDLSQPPAS